MNIVERQEAINEIRQSNKTRIFKNCGEREIWANETLLIVQEAMYVLLALQNLVKIITGIDRKMSIGLLVGVVVSAILILIIYKRDKTSDYYAQNAISIFIVFYTVGQLTSASVTFPLVIIPILIAAMLYSNVQIVSLYSKITVVTMIFHMSNSITRKDNIIESLLMTLIMCILLWMITRATGLLADFNRDIQGDIEDSKAIQSIIMEEQLSLALAVKNDTEAIGNYMSGLSDSNEIVAQSVEGITRSIGDVTRTIQQQTTMTTGMSDTIIKTREKSKTIIEATNVSKSTVTENLGKVTSLKEHSEQISEKSKNVAEQMRLLQEKAAQVSNITSLITDVAEETNLLSLNAMIEAACAGEAGKGFAVVASEVKKLSTQTKEASEKITEMLNDLSEFANSAVESVNISLEQTELQGKYIEDVYGGFENINTNMSGLSSEINEMDHMMETLYKDNEVVVRGITELYSVSEEINDGIGKAADTVVTNAESFRFVRAKHGALLDKVKRFNKYSS